jgi:MYXO-CTERM domain-containing protein
MEAVVVQFVSLALLLSAPDALACGGFFCDPLQPVYQAGEEIVFAVDDQACTVEAHVAIQYEGASEDFAWIVPVAGEPDLFTSSSAIFQAIRGATDPVYQLTRETVGICEAATFANDFALAESGVGDEFSDGINVVSTSRVGPYDTVVLQALNSGVLLNWLQNEGYDLPDTLDTALQPYAASNQYFVALKLASGNDVGDLTPLGMRYAGCESSIPIQLTSIAATDDMPIDVYVLGDARAVPDNYLHITLNDAAIDWWTGGANFSSAISRAADEAGGQAFSTTFSGPLAGTGITVWEGSFSEATYASTDDAYAFLSELSSSGMPWSDELIAILSDLIPVPEELEDNGVTPAGFYACMDCWWVAPDLENWDSVIAAERIAAEVIPGLEAAQDTLDAHAHLTRLTTTMDADEMTHDPFFVFNRDLPQEVSNVRRATERVNCGLFEGQRGAERTLVLEDGRKIRLPSRRWVANNQTTEIDLIAELADPAAILIEDFGEEGVGEIIFDYREDAARDARRFARPGCACTSAPSPAALGLLGLLLPLVARRRR